MKQRLNYTTLKKIRYDGYILENAPEKVMQLPTIILIVRTNIQDGTVKLQSFSRLNRAFLIE